MSDTPHLLSDFAAFTVNGPTVVFLRPKTPLSPQQAAVVAQEARQYESANLTFILVAGTFDLFVSGEAELAAKGYVKIETP